MRRAAGGGVVIVTLIAAALVVLSDRSDPAAGDVLLPDLWSSAPFELRLGTVEDRAVLRFTSEINNAGPGAFIVRGNSRDASFHQHLVHDGGGTTTQPVDVTIAWGGDTHYHWHIEDVARYWIEPADGATGAVPVDNKVGFCFFDGVDRLSGLEAAPTSPVHPPEGCGGRLDPSIDMGLSVGWGDQYRFDLEGQFIDIEDLPTGQYVLYAEVDPDRRFTELDRSNNVAATPFTLIVDAGGGRALLG